MAQPWRNPAELPRSGQTAPSERLSRSAMELSRVKARMEPGKDCAYNHTRGCFLGLHVVTGELSLPSLLDWITTLMPDSGTGIWMIPFRGMPSRELRTPVDLLYLDVNCRVLEAVELFPTFRVSTGCAPAASVLVLPAGTICSTKTEAGDQLLLCPTEEIKWRLEQLVETGSVGEAAIPLPARPPLRPVLVRELPPEPLRVEVSQVAKIVPPVEPQAPQAAIELPADLPCVAPTLDEQPGVAEPVRELPEPPAKPWMAREPVASGLGKLWRSLLPEPRDPRKVGRRPVEGLVAHFFTGGAPQAHEIRDVSATGLYVVTDERWYPGTIIRMTLTKPDMGQAPVDRSITVQTRAVRWGNDGVGLEFLLDIPQNSSLGNQVPLGGVNGEQLERFLKGIRNPGR